MDSTFKEFERFCIIYANTCYNFPPPSRYFVFLYFNIFTSFERQRDGERERPFLHWFTIHMPGQAQPRNPECSLSLPNGAKDSALEASSAASHWGAAGRWHWKQSWDLNLSPVICNMGVPSGIFTIGPNAHPCPNALIVN